MLPDIVGAGAPRLRSTGGRLRRVFGDGPTPSSPTMPGAVVFARWRPPISFLSPLVVWHRDGPRRRS
jgi:hypothetical protein